MNIEVRLANLENLVNVLSKKIDSNKNYTDADVSGNRASISIITPYTETKTAYYGEKEKPFYNVPSGNVTVIFSNYTGDYSVSRISDRITVSFDTLTEQTEVTINVK